MEARREVFRRVQRTTGKAGEDVNRSSINWLVNHDGSQGFSWNPIKGCSPAHIGCLHCYAARLAATRLAHLPAYAGLAKRWCVFGETGSAWTGDVRFFPELLDEPLRRRKPSSIFPCDMADLFHEKVTNEQIAAVFGVMAACPQHRFTVLTKRARRMREWFSWVVEQAEYERGVGEPPSESLTVSQYAFAAMDISEQDVFRGRFSALNIDTVPPWPLPNVALLVSVSDQRTADELIPELLQTPSAMRGVSYEPAVGPVDFSSWLGYDDQRSILDTCPHGRIPWGRCDVCEDEMPAGSPGWKDLGLSWIVCGGESGPRARPCNVEWIRSVVRQCAEAKVPCWVKQYGANAIGDGYDLSDETVRELDAAGWWDDSEGGFRLPLRDRAGANTSEWSHELNMRQRPAGW